MSAKGFGDSSRVATMVCTSCDVTWRGVNDDDCWSCGDASMVTAATPRKVRYSPAVAEEERLVG